MSHELGASEGTDSLQQLMDDGDVTEKPYRVFAGHNLGHPIFLMQIPMHQFFTMSDVANDPARDGASIAQRKLDPVHAQKLAIYILKGLVAGAAQQRLMKLQSDSASLAAILDRLGRQPYLSLQPLVANIRGCGVGGCEIRGRRLLTREEVLAGTEVFLSQRHVLWVVDGQHRRMAMKMVFEFLEYVLRNGYYPKKGTLYGSPGASVNSNFLGAWQETHSAARSFCKVSIEVHLGLEPEQERQLFHDLNNLGKKVDRSLALKFDNSNPINLFIKDILHDSLGLKLTEKEVHDWRDDDGALAWKDVVAINAILFLNKTNIGGAKPADVLAKSEIAKQFWEAIAAIPGFGEPRAKVHTVAAQPVVLKSLAKLLYDFAFSPRRATNGDELADQLLSQISDIDFSHSNPAWQFYSLSEVLRKDAGLDGLEDFVPTLEGGNRDLGLYQEGLMRFGAKHNDIYPILGDIIRWTLRLPSRRK